MAIEKFINGKHDDAHHEWKRSEVRRLAEANSQMIDFLYGDAGRGDFVSLPINKIPDVQLVPSPHLTKGNKKV